MKNETPMTDTLTFFGTLESLGFEPSIEGDDGGFHEPSKIKAWQEEDQIIIIGFLPGRGKGRGPAAWGCGEFRHTLSSRLEPAVLEAFLAALIESRS